MFSDFLSDHVLGRHNVCKSDAQPLKTAYNKILQGKLLVVFEELPTFSTNDWAGVSSKLKDMVTSNELVYSEKYERAITMKNLNNYIINTNVDAIQHSDGRRYCVLDVSTKYQQNHEYFGNLTDQCFNDEVGAAYYNYLLSIDVANFNGQKDDPDRVPYVLQPNKRDLPTAVPVQDLVTALRRGDEPVFEAVATRGTGVFDTLKAAVKQVLVALRSR